MLSVVENDNVVFRVVREVVSIIADVRGSSVVVPGVLLGVEDGGI